MTKASLHRFLVSAGKIGAVIFFMLAIAINFAPGVYLGSVALQIMVPLSYTCGAAVYVMLMIRNSSPGDGNLSAMEWVSIAFHAVMAICGNSFAWLSTRSEETVMVSVIGCVLIMFSAFGIISMFPERTREIA